TNGARGSRRSGAPRGSLRRGAWDYKIARCGMRDAGCEMRDGWGAGPHPASPITHPVYSYLIASTGSSLAALLAGYRPNPMPVRAEAARAATTDHSGTCAGIGVRRATPNA